MENNGNVSSLSTRRASAEVALPEARTTASTVDHSTVIVISVLTQTVHSTLVVTESTVPSSVPATLQTTTTESWAATLETALYSSREEHAAPHTTEQWAGVLGHSSAHTTTSSPVPDLPVLASSSTPSLHVVSTSTASSVLSIVTSSSTTRVISTSITQHVSSQHVSTWISPLDSPTSSPTTNVTSGSLPTQASAGHTAHEPVKVAVIAGAAVGGAALLALGVIACCLFFRRKGHPALLRQQTSRQGLLSSNPSSPTRGLRNREISEPTLPAAQPIPSAPVFPARRYPSSVISHSDWEVPARDWPLMGPLVLTDNNHGQEDPFADPEDSPVAPSIEITVPSNAASAWSLLECAAQPRVHQNNYHSGGTSLMPPSITTKANKADITKVTKANTTKASTAYQSDDFEYPYFRDAYCARVRSDPWDLESSLDFLQQRPA